MAREHLDRRPRRLPRSANGAEAVAPPLLAQSRRDRRRRGGLRTRDDCSGQAREALRVGQAHRRNASAPTTGPTSRSSSTEPRQTPPHFARSRSGDRARRATSCSGAVRAASRRRRRRPRRSGLLPSATQRTLPHPRQTSTHCRHRWTGALGANALVVSTDANRATPRRNPGEPGLARTSGSHRCAASSAAAPCESCRCCSSREALASRRGWIPTPPCVMQAPCRAREWGLRVSSRARVWPAWSQMTAIRRKQQRCCGGAGPLLSRDRESRRRHAVTPHGGRSPRHYIMQASEMSAVWRR